MKKLKILFTKTCLFCMTVSHSMEEISEKHKNTIQNQQQNLEREEEVIQNIDLEEQNPLNKKIEIFQVKTR